MTFIFETDEESGSKDIVWYINENKNLFKTPDLVLCLDSGALDYQSMYLTTSLRGSIKMTIKTQVLDEGVHSGNGSGYVADSFRILTDAISQLEDQKTGRLDENLYVNIPSDKYQAAMKLNEVRKGDFDLKFPLHKQVKYMHQDLFKAYLNRTWEPTLTVIG